MDYLISLAKASLRLRMHFNLQDSSEDQSPRMLNAIDPCTVIPIHRHTMTSKDVIVMRGRACEVFFDDQGNETGCRELIPGGDISDIHVPMGQYHTCLSLESGTEIIKFKNTKYDPVGTEVYLQKK